MNIHCLLRGHEWRQQLRNGAHSIIGYRECARCRKRQAEPSVRYDGHGVGRMNTDVVMRKLGLK
jgi:hypothetical protein